MLKAATFPLTILWKEPSAEKQILSIVKGLNVIHKKILEIQENIWSIIKKTSSLPVCLVAGYHRPGGTTPSAVLKWTLADMAPTFEFSPIDGKTVLLIPSIELGRMLRLKPPRSLQLFLVLQIIKGRGMFIEWVTFGKCLHMPMG